VLVAPMSMTWTLRSGSCAGVSLMSALWTYTKTRWSGDTTCGEIVSLGGKTTAAYQREWAHRNPDKLREYQRRYRAKNKETWQTWQRVLITSLSEYCAYLKETTPCLDCGEYDEHYVMEFDHLDGSQRVCSPSAAGGWGRMFREIAKCEIVCARCHRIRTWKRRNVAEAA